MLGVRSGCYQGISAFLDLHETIDDHTSEGNIPVANRDRLRTLLHRGVPLLICSYIGRSIGEGAEKERPCLL